MSDLRCDNCEAFAPWEVPGDADGECRLIAPHPVAGWPEADADDWCLQIVPKAQPAVRREFRAGQVCREGRCLLGLGCPCRFLDGHTWVTHGDLPLHEGCACTVVEVDDQGHTVSGTAATAPPPSGVVED